MPYAIVYKRGETNKKTRLYVSIFTAEVMATEIAEQIVEVVLIN